MQCHSLATRKRSNIDDSKYSMFVINWKELESRTPEYDNNIPEDTSFELRIAWLFRAINRVENCYWEDLPNYCFNIFRRYFAKINNLKNKLCDFSCYLVKQGKWQEMTQTHRRI